MTNKSDFPPSDDDPTGGHDPQALADAKRKMHIEKSPERRDDDDPTRGHDQHALDDAARKMNVKR
jgi:hypothetical protein